MAECGDVSEVSSQKTKGRRAYFHNYLSIYKTTCILYQHNISHCLSFVKSAEMRPIFNVSKAVLYHFHIS